MEIWKEIQGFNGVYFVSNTGFVKSIDHYPKSKNGIRKQKGRMLKQSKCSKGYLRVTLSLNKKRFNKSVHRLVAFSFVENPKNNPQVNHINGVKSDNYFKNLEWVTNSENQIHAVKNKLIKHNYGEKHHMSKLTNKEVFKARHLHDVGYTLNELYKIFKISKPAMSKILRKETYKNI